jgi:glycosyltransferase involved in cell wall biosynthesis
MGASILYLDQAYSLADARQRKQVHFLEARDRNGFFDKVWSVHPLLGVMNNRWAKRFDRQSISPTHQVVEGFIEGGHVPKFLRPLNVLVAQIRMVLECARIVRRNDVDLIYATDCFYLGALGAVIKMLTGRPLMVGIFANHDLAYETTGVLAYPRLLRFRRLEQWVQRRVLRHADWIEVAAEDSARYVCRYGADPAKLVRLPVVKFIGAHHLVAPTERGDPAPLLARLGIPAGRPTLICVSRLRPVKYVLDALEAMRVALDEVPDAIGIFAGEGELRPEMEAKIRAWGLEDRIFLPGLVDQKTLGTLLPGCIALSPLTGMALIETSLAGAVPVVYDVEWQPEFVETGSNGFVVPFRDARAMGEAAIRLLRDSRLRSRMAEVTRQRALAFADPIAYKRAERAALERIAPAGTSSILPPISETLNA